MSSRNTKIIATRHFNRFHSSNLSSAIKVDTDVNYSYRSLDSLDLDEKTTIHTRAVSDYQKEWLSPTNNSVKELGIAITTNTAHFLSPTPSAYRCPLPLPTRSTSLAATTTCIMSSVPPPVPPKDLKCPFKRPASQPVLRQTFGVQDTPLEKRDENRTRRKTKRLRKRFQTDFSKQFKRDRYSRKTVLARLGEAGCSIM